MNSSSSEVYRIVKATIRDVWAIQQLEKAIFPKDAYSLFEILMLFITPHIYNMKAINAEGKLIGYLAVSKDFGPFAAWIITIGVDEQYQRRGLGKRLMRWIEEELLPPRIRLTVRVSNTPAITLYEHMGYQQIEYRHRYYPDGEDGLVMEKVLSPKTMEHR
ncbi:MAG: hypothetical protein CUN55_07340 [Phototrophicales bacterium]|nr:MAG: hypothetical protein CUN55_07340 [Phototrophicales bacterium]